MQNIKAYQQAHDQYQQPTPQYLLVRQLEPIVQCNLSNMSSNYQSILYRNQEEVFYQIQQVFIPREDHLYRALGEIQKVEFYLQIIPYFDYKGFIPSAGNPFPLVRSVIDGDSFYFGYYLDYWKLPITLEIPTMGSLTPQQVAEQIKVQLQHHAFVNLQGNNDLATNPIAHGEQSMAWYKWPLLAAFFQCLQDFYYDSDAERYAFQFDMKESKVPHYRIPVEWRYQFPQDLEDAGGFNILGFDLIFQVAPDAPNYFDFKGRAKKLMVNMIGSDIDLIEGFTLAYPDWPNTTDIDMIVEANNRTVSQTFNEYSLFSTMCKANSVNITASLLHRAIQLREPGFTNEPFQQPIIAYSLQMPHFYTTEFCFVQSSADTSSWTIDGTRSTTLDVFHRADQSKVTDCDRTSPLIRTKLSSLRSLSLRLVDSDGELIYPAHPFYIKIVIFFQ